MEIADIQPRSTFLIACTGESTMGVVSAGDGGGQMKKHPTLQTSRPAGESRVRRPYVSPSIKSWTDEEVLLEVGPAQGYMQQVDGSRSYRSRLVK